MPFKDLSRTFIHHILILKSTSDGFIVLDKGCMDVHMCLLLHVDHRGAFTHAWHENTFVLTGTWALGGDRMISH